MGMQEDWPTEIIDMKVANDIIKKYQELNDNEPLSLVELTINKEEEDVEIRPADWVLELAKHFQDKYGYEHGQAITSHVITRCFLQGETVH